MLLRLSNLKTVVLLLVSVVALFFFPAPRGSFVSTHGPVTFIRSCWENALVWLAVIVLAVRLRFKITLGPIGEQARTSYLGSFEQSPLRLSVLRI